MWIKYLQYLHLDFIYNVVCFVIFFLYQKDLCNFNYAEYFKGREFSPESYPIVLMKHSYAKNEKKPKLS